MLFFKLTSKTNTQYLILENMNKKRLKFIYGLCQNTFKSIFDSIINKQKMINSVQPDKHKVLNDKSIYIRSKWNSKNIILDP